MHTAEAKDAYLDAIVMVEEKTQDAINACGECGHPHPETEPHKSHIAGIRDNVIDVDFRPEPEEESETG